MHPSEAEVQVLLYQLENQRNANEIDWHSDSIASVVRIAARRAYDYLSHHGWTQGMIEANDGRVCLLGAIQKSTQIEQVRTILVQEIHKVAEINSIPAWNDRPERIRADVENVLVTIAGGGRGEDALVPA